MKNGTLAKISSAVLAAVLVLSTIFGAFAAPIGTHLLYAPSSTASSNTASPLLDSLKEDYDAIMIRVEITQKKVAVIGSEIDLKISSNEKNTAVFAQLNSDLEALRQKINEILLPEMKLQKAKAASVGSAEFAVLFADLENKASEILFQIKIEQKKIVQHKFLLQLEQEINDIQERYESAYDDYKEFKRKLEKALKDDDSDDVNKFKRELRELSAELDAMLHDIQGLFLKAAQRNAFQLRDDALAVKEAVLELQEDIDDLLKLKKVDRKRGKSYEYVDDDAPQFAGAEPEVIVESLDFIPQQETATKSAADSNWEEFRNTLWLFAGNAILLAVILFLIALLNSNTIGKVRKKR